MGRTWMATVFGLAAAFLTTGCRQSQKCSDCYSAKPTAPTASVVSATPPPARRLELTPPMQPVQAAPRPLPSMAVAQAPINVEQSAPPVQPTPRTIEPTAAPAAAPVAEKNPPNATQAAGTYNSPDYSILFGMLDYNARRGIWKLRYADAGQEDRYGGCVTLEGVGRQMSEFKSGQMVRVEGCLVDPNSQVPSPAYRVRDVRPVE